MNPRRASRPFRSNLVEGDGNNREAECPTIPPFLVDHLREHFPIGSVLSARRGLDGAVDTAIEVAEQRGREQVIAYLARVSADQKGA